jgi:hypothetical protein
MNIYIGSSDLPANLQMGLGEERKKDGGKEEKEKEETNRERISSYFPVFLF